MTRPILPFEPQFSQRVWVRKNAKRYDHSKTKRPATHVQLKRIRQIVCHVVSYEVIL